MATASTIKGEPQITQNGVLVSTRRRRCSVVPPPGRLRWALLTLTHPTRIAANKAARARCQRTPSDCSQSRNQVLLLRERFCPSRYHGSLNSCAPSRPISKTRGCQEKYCA